MRNAGGYARFALVPVVAGLLFLGTACPTRQNQGRRDARNLYLELLDSLRLPGPAIGLCTDHNGLLLADRSGTDVYRADYDLRSEPPLALGTRIAGVRGIAADPFFVYLYDDGHIYRLDRSSGEMTQISSGIDCVSATVLDGGELAFGDAMSNRILVIDPTQNVSVLSSDRSDLQPDAFAVGPDGNTYVLGSSRREVVVLSRIGESVRSIPLPGSGTRIALDDSLRVYVLERTGTRLWRIDQRGRTLQADAGQLGLNFVASEMLVVGDWLFLLDRDLRILKLQIPLVTG